MRYFIFFFILCYALSGASGLFNYSQESLALSMPSCAMAQESEPPVSEGSTMILRTLLFFAVFAVLWFIFYKLVYPFLLDYYTPKYSKSLFWSMFGLYSIAWLCISSYVIFEVGFYYYWAKLVFVFIWAVWFIWLLSILLKKDSAY